MKVDPRALVISRLFRHVSHKPACLTPVRYHAKSLKTGHFDKMEGNRAIP
jgi:hypothetical protein